MIKEVLNRLLQESPLDPLSQDAAESIQTAACEAVTAGMSFLFPNPLDQCILVQGLVEEVLGQEVCPSYSLFSLHFLLLPGLWSHFAPCTCV